MRCRTRPHSIRPWPRWRSFAAATARGATLVEGSITDPGFVAAQTSAFAPARIFHLAAQVDVRKAVASPGGSTEAGLEALDRLDARRAFEAAVEASLERMRA